MLASSMAHAISIPPLGPIFPPPTQGAADFDIARVVFNPSFLTIPCGGFCNPNDFFAGGSRGFTKPATFTVNIDFSAIYTSNRVSTAELTVSGVSLLLLERDALSDDKVQVRADTTYRESLTVHIGSFPPRHFGTIPVQFTVSAAQLNGFCAGGCNTRAGYLEERAFLEFALDRSASTMDVTFSGLPSFRDRINLLGQSLTAPEPATVLLLVPGLFILFRFFVTGPPAESIGDALQVTDP